MIATREDVLVLTRADFERLPEDGRWEVVDGRAILLPPLEIPHQKISMRLGRMLDERVEALGNGFVVAAISIFIPRAKSYLGEVQSRVPDLIVSRREPRRYFDVGEPPDLVIEILSTRRGNVERTEKVDDYACAGIGEYWIVSPFDCAVEIYRLRGSEYAGPEIISQGILEPRCFPGLQMPVQEIWPKK